MNGASPLLDIVRRHRWHMALGAISLIAGLLIAAYGLDDIVRVARTTDRGS